MNVFKCRYAKGRWCQSKKGDTGQASAIIKGISANAGDVFRYRDTGQARALPKGKEIDIVDTRRNINTGQVGALGEGKCTDAGELTILSKGNTCKIAAGIECKIADDGDTVRYGDTGETRTFEEGPVPDASDTTWNCYASQAGAIFEGLQTNTVDRFAFNGIRNHKFPRSRSITVSDHDRVFINTIG